MLCLAAYAKINWTLDILGTRPDGYHLMDMLMQTVSLCDLLWMEEAEDLTLEAVPGGTERAARSKTNDGLSSAGVRYDESNLVYRAALLLRERCGVRRGARIQLEKRIPSGAGMGGGSADCAAALKGLNALWGLGLSRAELLSLGLELGADVPFLITGGLARVGGIGERIQPLLPAPQVWLVLVQPCEGLSTREVFSVFDRMDASSLRHPDNAAAQDALLRRDLTALAPAMANVLQAVSERTGKPDTRGAYGLLGSELIGALTHLQHARGKHVVFVAILDERLDDFNRKVFVPQIEGAKTAAELPGIVDEVVTLAEIKAEDGSIYRAFVCHTVNPYGVPAKDRSGQLELLEPPNLRALIDKCAAATRIPTSKE